MKPADHAVSQVWCVFIFNDNYFTFVNRMTRHHVYRNRFPHPKSMPAMFCEVILNPILFIGLKGCAHLLYIRSRSRLCKRFYPTGRTHGTCIPECRFVFRIRKCLTSPYSTTCVRVLPPFHLKRNMCRGQVDEVSSIGGFTSVATLMRKERNGGLITDDGNSVDSGG